MGHSVLSLGGQSSDSWQYSKSTGSIEFVFNVETGAILNSSPGFKDWILVSESDLLF